MQVEISTQFMIDDILPIHMGEVLSVPEHRGEIGWIDWCNEQGSSPGIHTAKLEIVGGMFEILVHPDHRGPEQNIGQELFEQMVDRLRSLGYEELLIIGAIDSALPFYRHTLNSLAEADIVESYAAIDGVDRNTVDNHDLRVTFKPKPMLLPE